MTRPQIAGIHHLKFAVSDLERSESFYVRMFGARRIAAFDHRTAKGMLYAIILDVPGLTTHLELRLNPAAAQRQGHFDPVTFAVAARAELDAWIIHLDTLGIAHSPVLTGLKSWLIVAEDPDGRRLRLYSLESHEGSEPASSDSPWLRD